MFVIIKLRLCNVRICEMLYSLDSPSCELQVKLWGFDRSSGGFIGTLPDYTAGVLRLKSVLAGITFMVMVSALEPD